MKHSIDLIDLMYAAKNSDSTEVRELTQKIASTLKVGRSQIMPLTKIELGLIVRSLGEGYASEKRQANWSFTVNYDSKQVILTTPINNVK